jgi:hypothetical protein
MTAYTEHALHAFRESLLEVNRIASIYGAHLPADLPAEERALLLALAQTSERMLRKIERELFDKRG